MREAIYSTKAFTLFWGYGPLRANSSLGAQPVHAGLRQSSSKSILPADGVRNLIESCASEQPDHLPLCFSPPPSLSRSLPLSLSLSTLAHGKYQTRPSAALGLMKSTKVLRNSRMGCELMPLILRSGFRVPSLVLCKKAHMKACSFWSPSQRRL